MCWVKTKSNTTRLPLLYNLDCLILILKQPSPLVKPATHWGSNSSLGGNNGLAKGTVLGKASNSNGVNPGPLGPGSSNVYYFL